MASEISWRHYATGSTLYFTVRSSARTMWKTSGTPALEALTVANWANYAIALTETPASSYFFVGTWPATLTTAGWYWIDIYLRVGGSAAIGDTLVGGMVGWWNGTTFKPWADDLAQILGTAPTEAETGGLAARISDAAMSSELIDTIGGKVPATIATGDCADAAALKAALLPITGAVNDAAATTTTFITNLTSAVDNFYKGRITFTSGALDGQFAYIQSYIGSTKALTLQSPASSAPVNGVTFSIENPLDVNLTEKTFHRLDDRLNALLPPRHWSKSIVRHTFDPLDLPKGLADSVVHFRGYLEPDTGFVRGVYTPISNPSHGLGMLETPWIARSADGITGWSDAGISNPVVAIGAPGSWNEVANVDPDKTYVDEIDKFVMVVVGQCSSTTHDNSFALYVSTDGLTNWTPYAGTAVHGLPQPLILSGPNTGDTDSQAWELYAGNCYVGYPTLIPRNGKLYVFYSVVWHGVDDDTGLGCLVITFDGSGNIVSAIRSEPIDIAPTDGVCYAGISHISICEEDGIYYLYGFRRQIFGDLTKYVNALWTTTDLDNQDWQYQGIVHGLPSDPSEWDSKGKYLLCPVTDYYKNVVQNTNGIRTGYDGGGAIGEDWTHHRIGVVRFVGGNVGLTNVDGQVVASDAKLLNATDPAQLVRDAMKLAPSAGDPATGSIDKHLDDIPTADAIGTDAASKILVTPANKLVTDAEGKVTAGTVSDKTGYALTSAYDAAKDAASQSSVDDKTGYSLSATGLDLIADAEPVGKPTNWIGWMRWLIQRYRSASMTNSSLQVKKEDGTVATTQTLSDDGVTQEVGPPV